MRRRPVPRVLEDLHRALIAALGDMDDDPVDRVVVGAVGPPPVRRGGGYPLGARVIHLAGLPGLLHPRQPPPGVLQLLPRQRGRAHGRDGSADQQPAPASMPRPDFAPAELLAPDVPLVPM